MRPGVHLCAPKKSSKMLKRSEVFASLTRLSMADRPNQWMNQTRVVPVIGPKCARISLAHFGPGKQLQRADYLGR
jgi:hypothetical protein